MDLAHSSHEDQLYGVSEAFLMFSNAVVSSKSLGLLISMSGMPYYQHEIVSLSGHYLQQLGSLHQALLGTSRITPSTG